METVWIVPCENGVGEWEIRSDFGMHETFDTRQEAEERLAELQKKELDNGERHD
tara:strand:- start:427 stop:588 length:162 start_codon:yes stop_codon:yes gene_type:complete